MDTDRGSGDWLTKEAGPLNFGTGTAAEVEPFVQGYRLQGRVLLQQGQRPIARRAKDHAPRQPGDHHTRRVDQPDAAAVPGHHHAGDAVYLQGARCQSYRLVADRSHLVARSQLPPRETAGAEWRAPHPNAQRATINT